MRSGFTGWHMAAILIGFFAVVIGVNTVMATEAVRTFGGTVVENSYVESQKFDAMLDAARAQRRLSWRAEARVGADGRLLLELHGPKAARVRASVDHPLGRAPSRSFAMRPLGGDRYVADQALGAGRWLLRIEVAAAGRTARFEQEVRR